MTEAIIATIFQPIYYNSFGVVSLASSSSESTQATHIRIGNRNIRLQNGTIYNEAIVVSQGVVTWPAHGLIVGSQYYLSSTAGTFSVNAPTNGFIQQIFTPISPDHIEININKVGKEIMPFWISQPRNIDESFSIPNGVNVFLRFSNKIRDFNNWYDNTIGISEFNLPIGYYMCRFDFSVSSNATSPRVGFVQIAGSSVSDWALPMHNSTSRRIYGHQAIDIRQPNTKVQFYFRHDSGSAISIPSNQTQSFLTIERFPSG